MLLRRYIPLRGEDGGVTVIEPSVTAIRSILTALDDGGELNGMTELSVYTKHWEAVKAHAAPHLEFTDGLDLDSLGESELKQLVEEGAKLSPFFRKLVAILTPPTTNVTEQSPTP